MATKVMFDIKIANFDNIVSHLRKSDGYSESPPLPPRVIQQKSVHESENPNILACSPIIR